MAEQVKIISSNNFSKVEDEATKLVAKGWTVKAATTAIVQGCFGFYSKLELVIVLEK